MFLSSISIVVCHHLIIQLDQELLVDDRINVLAQLIQDEPVSSSCLVADVGDIVNWNQPSSHLQQSLSQTGGEDDCQAITKLIKIYENYQQMIDNIQTFFLTRRVSDISELFCVG